MSFSAWFGSLRSTHPAWPHLLPLLSFRELLSDRSQFFFFFFKSRNVVLSAGTESFFRNCVVRQRGSTHGSGTHPGGSFICGKRWASVGWRACTLQWEGAGADAPTSISSFALRNVPPAGLVLFPATFLKCILSTLSCFLACFRSVEQGRIRSWRRRLHAQTRSNCIPPHAVCLTKQAG